MSKQELIESIVAYEWDDFEQVNNIGGTASCQNRPETFTRMRTALLSTWSEELLQSYLDDVRSAAQVGRSPMSEKYAWMMESTDPAGFAAVQSKLPHQPAEKLAQIDHIARFFLVWQALANERYPRLTAHGRPLLAESDRADNTSFETYMRGEMKSYSAKTVALYDAYATACWKDGINLSEENLNNIARSYGYRDAADAEKRSS